MTSPALELIDRFTDEALDELALVDGRGKAATLAALEMARRKIEAATAAVIADADRSDAFRDDGHVSVRGWVKASVRMSNVEVSHAVRVARLCRELPACAEALAAGRLGVAQARELASVLNNPRCGEQLGEVIADLLESATEDTHEVFVRVLREWESLVDADGAHRDHESAHLARRARIAIVGATVYLDGEFGAAQGSAMAEILDRFSEAEFEHDLDDLHFQQAGGDPGIMQRSDAQRRADAIAKIFERAAGTLPGAAGTEPVVNIVISQDVFEEQVAAMATGRAPTFDADGVGEHCSMTTDGNHVDPADAVAAALIGRIRRVVLRDDGVIINFGRRARVFTGSLHEAAIVQSVLDRTDGCIWPGCCQRRRRCQHDHIDEWRHGGPTDLDNTGLLCPRHNRFKSQGFRCWRDPTGRWHVYRPDGTEIRAA